MSKMKVLVVTNMYPTKERPNYGIFVKEQIQSLERRYDYNADVFFIDGKKSKFSYIKSVFQIRNILQSNKYDLIHIHYGLSGIFLLFLFWNKVPVLTTFHGSDIQRESGTNHIALCISKIVAKLSDAVIVLNENMYKNVKILNSNTYIIPCAVDTNLFMPIGKEELCRKRNYENDVRVIFPSNKERYVKNYPLFQETIIQFEKKYGIDVQEYELNSMSRQEVVTLYNQCDLLLMTSRSEGSPQVIKEAMSCNLPCVATPVGDVSKLLKNVKGCYTSKMHNAMELADLMYKSITIEDGEICGREKIFILGLDEDSICEKIISLCKKIIQGKRLRYEKN